MLVSTPGILGSAGGGVPPAGIWISSVCSGPDAFNQGNADYYDVNGTLFNGMFTLWEQFTDGAGGTYWSNIGSNTQDGKDPNTACWYPAYYYFDNTATPYNVHWSGCGSDGYFEYGVYYTSGYWNGDGTTTTSSYFNDYGFPAGTTIYDNGSGCCYVYYDGAGGYYVSDTCGPSCETYGTFLYSGCNNTSGYDAGGVYWEATWAYGNFYADGNCGTYFSSMGDNTTGCYYPYGYWMSYSSSSNSFEWQIFDTCSNLVANGYFTYNSSYSGDRADGSGSSYSESGFWSASYGDLIASGTFNDCDSNYYNYEVYYNGSGGYYTNIY